MHHTQRTKKTICSWRDVLANGCPGRTSQSHAFGSIESQSDETERQRERQSEREREQNTLKQTRQGRVSGHEYSLAASFLKR